MQNDLRAKRDEAIRERGELAAGLMGIIEDDEDEWLEITGKTHEEWLDFRALLVRLGYGCKL